MRKQILDEVREVLMSVDTGQIEALADAIMQAPKVMFVGRGRVGLSLRAFCMRLGHLGIQACMSGGMTSFALSEGDLVIIGNCSGSGDNMMDFLNRAHKLGCKVWIVHCYNGPVAQQADGLLTIHARIMETHLIDVPSLQPMCATFEQVLLMLGDTIARMIQQRTGDTEQMLRSRHATIE
ncbi:MAG: hypothetical protein ACOX88_08055 [Christensenellales bacterium]